MALKTLDDHRRTGRVDFQGRVELDVPHRAVRLEGNSLNLSQRGVCLRMQESLDVKAPVTLRLYAQSRHRPLQCLGRVAWVVQRLDLRDIPPFLYDVGVEFVRPPAHLRQLASRVGLAMRGLSARPMAQAGGIAGKRVKHSSLQPAAIRGRSYEPRVVHELGAQVCWHLVVKVDGAPCFSQRYASERESLQAWNQFKRQMARRPTREVVR